MPRTESVPSKSLVVRTLLLVFACLFPMAVPAVEDTSRVRTTVDAAILPLMSQHDIPGMVVGLILDGQPYVVTYGVASKEANVPVAEATLFEIGSVSKVFTATLAAYAQTTGKLSLDDHPGKYLPQLKGTPIDQATLLHLGTYTAGGLPLQFPDEVTGEVAVMDYFRNWTPLAPPGTRREYSNASPGLLGLVAASALDDDFATLMQSTVFPAFGMTDSFIHVPDRKMPDYAWGYRKDRPVRVNEGPLDEQAYGVKTTVSDLLRFVQANIDPSSLEPSMRRAVEATQVGYFRAGTLVQGLGWEKYPYPVSREWLLGGNAKEMLFDPQPAYRLTDQTAGERYLFNKTGSTGGFATYVAFVPARKIGIVMLANRSYPIPDRVEAAWIILEQLASGTDSN
uniref:Class C beta-lactamase IDC-2 n=1 Tax=sediment metagenome TaxID=749907 RepID=A0A6H2TY05_9ZZZZ